MLGCKRLQNKVEEMVFLWLVPQARAWRTPRSVVRSVCAMPFRRAPCGMWLQSTGQGAEVGFIISESAVSGIPSPPPSAEICFPLPWVSVEPSAADACRNRAVGIYISLASALLPLSRCFFRYRVTSSLAVSAIPCVLLHLLSSVSLLVPMEDPGLLLLKQNIVSGTSKTSGRATVQRALNTGY